MRIVKAEEAKSSGKLILTYGPSKVGKTTSALATMPCPVLFLQIEPRNQLSAINEAKKIRAGNPKLGELVFDRAYYENADAFMKFLADSNNFTPYASILVDSLSYLMNVLLAFEITDEAFESRGDKKKIDKPLISQNKLSMEGFGGLSSLMTRAMNLFSKLSLEYGKVIVFTALQTENVTYKGNLLQAAPNLKGKEFPNNLPAYLDLIGLVSQRRDEESGEVIYPPMIDFESPEGNFLAGWTGPSGVSKRGPLNISKILEIVNQEVNQE